MVEFADGGIDTIFASVSRVVDANVDNLTMLGNQASWSIGNELANVIRGNDLSNAVIGGDGDDWIYGGAGDDRITSGPGAITWSARAASICSSSPRRSDGTRFTPSNAAATG